MRSDCGAEEVSRVHMTSLNKMGCYSNSGSSLCQMKGPAAPHQSSSHSLKQSRKPKLYFLFFPQYIELIAVTWSRKRMSNSLHMTYRRGGAGGLFGYMHSYVHILRPSQAAIKREDKQIEHERVSDISWLLLKRCPQIFIDMQTASWPLILLISQPRFSWFAQTRATLLKQKSKTVMLTSVHVASEGELESLFYFRCSTFTLIFGEFSPAVSLQQNPGDKGYSFKNKWVFSVKSQ